MGVHIPNVEMPKSCGDCPFRMCFGYDDEIDCTLIKGAFMAYPDSHKRRHKDCPLVEVPPHGDLIDRDAFLEDMNCGLWDWSTVDGITATTALKQTMSDLRNTPTVLEAEGKDDG